jgi:hypothetical protein
MTPAQVQLARRRLWLGITNVGFWVLAACTGLGWLMLYRADAPSPWLLAAIGFGALAAQAAFDFLGGGTLMPEPRPSSMTFVHTWSRGFLVHTLVLAGVGIANAISIRLTGGFGIGMVLSIFALAIGRLHFLRLIGGVKTAEITQDGDRLLVAEAKDPAFTGGIVGLGRRAKSLLPGRWMESLPKPELAAETSRRRWQIAHAISSRTFIVILLWNLLGTFIGTQVFQLAARPPAVALLGHACWMTLWAFASLLVLPALSRKAVLAADRAAAESGHDIRAWIARFPDLVGEDGSPNAAVQTIFYPVPSAEMRLRQLGQPSTGFIPGNLARSNLYYSWATFTLLGRAVHCNVGRPALWVFPPSA